MLFKSATAPSWKTLPVSGGQDLDIKEFNMTSDFELVDKILDGFYYEDSGVSRANQQGFDQTDIFVDRYFNEDFAEIIYNSITKDTDLSKVATLFDVLVWSTPDNGTRLEELVHNWITSDNKTKVQIILLRQDWFPRQDREENIKVLEKVKLKFPDLAELCNYHLEEFDYQKKTGLRRIELLFKIADKLKKS